MEEKGKYVIDEEVEGALEMLGKGYEDLAIEIEQPRKVTERRNGKLVETDRPAFVKIFTHFKAEMKEIDADALKVWLFIALSVNRFSGEAHPGLRAISEGVGMAVGTVRDAVERLENKYELLQVHREEGKSNKYYPADYVSANRGGVSPDDTVPETVSKTDGTVSNQYRKSAQPEEPEEPDTPKKRSVQFSDPLWDLLLHGKKVELTPEMEAVLRIRKTWERIMKDAPDWERWGTFDKWLLAQEKDGRTVEKFCTHFMSDEFRAKTVGMYSPNGKRDGTFSFKRMYPQAFPARTSAPEPPQQKTELEQFLENEERRKHGNR